jgi:endonuclease-8
MPEGHTIHRLARDQRRDLAGHPLAVSSPQGRFAESAALLDGRTVRSVEAFGKHLFHRWEDGQVLHVHLGLIGKFFRRPSPAPPPVGAVRLRMEGPEATWDLSGPAICALVGPEEIERVAAGLGPDPLRRGADPAAFVAKISRSAKPIGALLLDQSVVAGIGNVFRAEVLFLHGIHPETPGRDLTEQQVIALWDELVAQLRAGVRRNRIVTLRPEDLGRSLGRLSKADALYVYHHEACRRCGGPIEALNVANRRIDACPSCQPRLA